MAFVRWHYRRGAYVRSHHRRLRPAPGADQGALLPAPMQVRRAGSRTATASADVSDARPDPLPALPVPGQRSLALGA